MNHEHAFHNFLEKTVNLNKGRYDTAEAGIETMTELLKNNKLFGGKFIATTPQGSFRQETIIKPTRPEQDFDVDLLFEMEVVEGWEPVDYLSKLADQFRAMDRYKDKVDTRGKTRCVTIDYESDFHIDIVPAISLPSGQFIMNKTTNQFEPTDGDGYSQWFERRNAITRKKYLTKVIRLLKHIRDDKSTFEVKSVLLTTLVGNQVLDGDTHTVHYSDLPTSFLTLLSRLDAHLQANPTMRTVTNPVLPSENFNRHWDQEKYRIFRERIHEYTQIAAEAYAEADEARSLKLWQKIFGNSFTPPAQSVKSSGSVQSVGTRDPGEMFLSDLKIAEKIQYSVAINARVEQDGWRPFFLRNALQILRKRRKLEFFVENCDVPSPYSVKWKIKNTGTEASSLKALRGEIVDDRGYRTRNESTLYEGAHYVEVYIIQGDVCVAKDRIDVPIGQF